MSLLDKHIDIEALTEGMSNSEKRAYDLGVIASVQALLSEFQASKENLSNTMLDLRDQGELNVLRELELQSRLHIMDVYSNQYEIYLDQLSEEYL